MGCCIHFLLHEKDISSLIVSNFTVPSGGSKIELSDCTYVLDNLLRKRKSKKESAGMSFALCNFFPFLMNGIFAYFLVIIIF